MPKSIQARHIEGSSITANRPHTGVNPLISMQAESNIAKQYMDDEDTLIAMSLKER